MTRTVNDVEGPVGGQLRHWASLPTYSLPTYSLPTYYLQGYPLQVRAPSPAVLKRPSASQNRKGPAGKDQREATGREGATGRQQVGAAGRSRAPGPCGYVEKEATGDGAWQGHGGRTCCRALASSRVEYSRKQSVRTSRVLVQEDTVEMGRRGPVEPSDRR